MKKITICIILILSWYQFLGAQNEFTYYVPAARGIGYGGSLVANTNNPSIVYWNPGGIAYATNDKVLVNLKSPSSFNYISFTKFMPPKNSIGFSLSRLEKNDELLDVATAAYSYRISQFFSIGANVNYSKNNSTDEYFITAGIGCLLKPTINRYSFYRTSNSPLHLFINPSLYDKFAFGIMIHNIPLDSSKTIHELRIGSAFKFSNWGPNFNFGYHIHHGENNFHSGVGINLFSHFCVYMGAINLDKNNFAFGGSISAGIFTADFAHATRSKTIMFSLSIQLNQDANTLAQRYKDQGTKKVRESDFRAALVEFDNSLAYNQNNERIIYLTSILKKRIEKENSKIDSLFTEANRQHKKDWNIHATLTLKEVLKIDRNNKKAKKAIKALQPGLAQDIEKFYNEGEKDYSNNNLEDAKDKFNYILHVEKNHKGAFKYLAKIDSINSHLSNEYYFRGLGYYNQRRLNKARENFKQVLEMNTKHNQAKFYLTKIDQELISKEHLIKRLLDEAHSLEKRGKFVLASTKYREILKHNKDFEKVAKQLDLLEAYINVIVKRKFNRAKSLFNKGDYLAARAAFKDILSIKPTHREAKRYLKRNEETQSEKIDKHYQLAEQYYKNKMWDNALKELDRVLANFPDHTDAKKMQNEIGTNIGLEKLQDKGMELFNKGAYLRALKIFNQIIEKDPDHVIAKTQIDECRNKLSKRISELFNSGMRYYTAGNYEAAIREWNRILEIDPNHESALEYKKRAQERREALEKLP